MLEKLNLNPKVKKLVNIGISVAMILIIIVLLFAMNGKNVDDTQIKLESGWTATINGNQYDNVSLDNFLFDVVGVGDVITLSCVLPYGPNNASVRLWICHSAIDAYLDGELFYEYGHDRLEEYKMVGSGFYFIELPDDYQGKTLTLKFTVGEIDAFGSFEPIYLEQTHTVHTSFLSSKLVSLLGGVFLCVIGLVGICLSSFVLAEMYQIRRLMYIFEFAFCVGMWTLCNDGLAQLFIGDYVICQSLEFITLFLAPIPILMFIRKEGTESDMLDKLVLILLRTCQIFCAAVFSLVAIGVLHFQHCLSFFHILMLLEVILIIVNISKRLRAGKKEDLYIFIGCIVLAFGAMVDVGAFYLKKYMHLYNRDIDFLTVIGSVVMVMCLFVSYFTYVSGKITASTEHIILEKLAYHDMLTGAINRVKYEELLDERDNEEEPYAIMYFDLNGLKHMNDTKGHAYGDELIKQFTLCLQVVYQGMGEVARLGGDEFAIILPNAGKKEIVDAVNRLQRYIKNHNSQTDIKLDTAFGVAFSIEATDHKSRTVSKLADTRMYDMKKRMKNARVE